MLRIFYIFPNRDDFKKTHLLLQFNLVGIDHSKIRNCNIVLGYNISLMKQHLFSIEYLKTDCYLHRNTKVSIDDASVNDDNLMLLNHVYEKQ